MIARDPGAAMTTKSKPTTHLRPTDYPMAMAELVHLFPVPVMHFDWDDTSALNERLSGIILDMRLRTAGVVKTNRGGWQSSTDLVDWPFPEVALLRRRIHELAIEYLWRTLGVRDARFDSGWSTLAWANINEQGHFNRSHDHLGRHSVLSGIYYVDSGDTGADGRVSGQTVFEDWSNVPLSVLDDADVSRANVRMTPRSGRMVLFPASLMHSVEVYDGTRPRITIAFNLYHPGLAVAHLEERELASHWWWRNFRGLMILRRKIPEKALALLKVPSAFAHAPLPRPVTLRGLRQHVTTTIDRTFALASEHSTKQ